MNEQEGLFNHHTAASSLPITKRPTIASTQEAADIPIDLYIGITKQAGLRLRMRG